MPFEGGVTKAARANLGHSKIHRLHQGENEHLSQKMIATVLLQNQCIMLLENCVALPFRHQFKHIALGLQFKGLGEEFKRRGIRQLPEKTKNKQKSFIMASIDFSSQFIVVQGCFCGYFWMFLFAVKIKSMGDNLVMEKVTAYEIAMIKSYTDSQSLPQCLDQPHDRYHTWNLAKILADLGLEYFQCQIAWLGFEQSSHIYSLFYCLLKASLANKNQKANLFIKLKHDLYQLGRKTLSPADQKKLVQMLSLAQYTTDLPKFLGKNAALEKIFVSIFRITLKESSLSQCTRMEELIHFCQKIPFVFLTSPQENICCLVIAEKSFHIIEHRKCYFVVEDRQQAPTHENLSSRVTDTKRTRRIKTCNMEQKQQILFSSRKKIQFSTPKFLQNSRKEKSCEKERKEIQVKTFDVSRQLTEQKKSPSKISSPPNGQSISIMNKKQKQWSPSLFMRNGLAFRSLGERQNVEKQIFGMSRIRKNANSSVRVSPKSFNNPEKPQSVERLFNKKCCPYKVTFTYTSHS